MTVYHVDKLYTNDGIYYAVFPYSLRGTFLIYFGFDFKHFEWRIGFFPWYSRYTIFLKWIWHTRFSKKHAQKLSDKLNKKLKE